VATAAVAIAFQPMQRRLQAIANRVVYGQRLSPYEAVASFAHRVEESFVSEDVLPAMAFAAAMGIGATRSRVRLFHPGGGESAVWWPEVDAATAPSDEFDCIVPVVHQGEQLGEIAIARDRGDPMTAHHEQLLGDIVSQAVLAMRSLRLTEELRQRLVELRESRRRLVTAQDEERRRMERDLHDGAQQILVAMKIKLGVAKSMIADEPEDASTMLDDISAQSSEAIDTLRDLARGLFPQALMDGGIVRAIESHIAKSGLRASVVADPTVTRFDPQTEANVYFVIREALQNASKYAPSASVVVHLGAAGDALTFDITDDGAGFDAASVKLGNGTQNMRDRLEALGGELAIDSTPGHGTCVHGRAPVALGAG
jgi:signal transduction histidine kinase